MPELSSSSVYVAPTDTFDEQRVKINALVGEFDNLVNLLTNNTITNLNISLDDLVDVTSSGAGVAQIIKYNGTEWVLDTDVVSTSFSVNTIAPNGGGALSYNNSNGTFTFTPAKLSDYRLTTATLGDIPGVTISNPVNTHVLQYDGAVWKNQPFAGVTDINDIGNVLITNPQNGHIIKYDSVNNRWINDVNSGAGGSNTINALNDIQNVTDTNTQNNQLLKYNSGAGVWENWTHNFLTSFTETDPVFVASPAYGITATQINNWNTAHGWGNHASVGYLLPVLTNLQTDEMLRWNGTNWINEPTSVHLHQFKSDWTEQDTAKPAYILNKPILATVATTGSFTDLTSRTLANLSDVATPGVVNGWILKHNGTSWEAASPTNITSLENLSNVTITNPSNGQVLKYNGTNWINDTDVTTSGGGGGATVTVADSAPSSPSNGDLWFKSNEGQLKVWYDDGVGTPSAQWVDTSNNAGGGTGSGGSGANVTIADTPPASFSAGDLWWKSNEGRLKIRYEDGSSNQWVDAFPVLDAPTYGYSISAEEGTGTSSKFRLTGTGDVAGTDDITFIGAGGLSVERTDVNTLTFRQGTSSGGGYSDNDAKDAAAAIFTAGTHQNITFNWDSTNRIMDVNAQASGGGGGTTYDLTGTSNTSNQAKLNLVAGNGDPTDTIEFAGSNGTDVTWDAANNKITINSKDYSVGAPAAASGSGSLALVGSTFTYTPPDLQNYLQTVPQASATILGGIKVGANLTMDAATGVLSANAGAYTLPTAEVGSSGQLGGVKVDGTTITIDGTGVITANAGSTTPSITDISGTTSSVAPGAITDLNITGYKGYVLYKVIVSHESWVRVFVDDASRQADDTRSEGNDPGVGSGVVAEVSTHQTNQSVLVTPGVMGFNNDDPRTDQIYLSVRNNSLSAATITVTLTLLKIGE